MLDFWTTWCGACRSAFPEFQKVYEKYKHHPEAAFLAVNTSRGDDTIAKVRTFVEQKNYRFPVAYDYSSRVSDKLKVTFLPTLLVIDKTGLARIKHIGYSQKFENYDLLLSKYIDEFTSKK